MTLHMPRAVYVFRNLCLALLAASVVTAQAGSANNAQLISSLQNPAPQSSVQPIHTDPETALREAIAKDVQDAWANSSFKKLDSLADEYVRTRARTFSGKWRLAVFAEALSGQMRIAWPDEWWLAERQPECRCHIPDPARYQQADLRWNALQEKLDLWIKQFPNSPHAQVARAQFLVNRAWFYRGTGYADTVPDVAWPRFSKYIEAARNTLVETRSTSIANPEWFNIMIPIASAQSWQTSRVAGLVRDLFEFGQSYATAYQSAAGMLLPKWGGSYEMIEAFAREAIKRTAPEEGAAIYARIYWQVDFGPTTFHDTRADWATMKRGFDEMILKYPDPRNVNGKAMFACMAGDAATFNSTIKQLGERVRPDTWFVPVDACKSRFGAVESGVRPQVTSSL
jgi:hypothetical protein